jgi:hypothetical protein
MKAARVSILVAIVCLLAPFGLAEAAEEGAKKNQVFFRGGYSGGESRSGEVFVDTAGLGPTLGAGGLNDGTGGLAVSAGLDIMLRDACLTVPSLTLAGEIFVEHARFSKKTVPVASSVLVNNIVTTYAVRAEKVQVSALNVTVAPKLRYDGFGMIRPWVIPVGLAVIVNSPPSDHTTYINNGLHFGGGLEVVPVPFLSIGADFRYTYSFDEAETTASYWSAGGYLGINF